MKAQDTDVRRAARVSQHVTGQQHHEASNPAHDASANGLPELWVGPECTINRVGDRWRDQSELTGFARRPEDFARLASLGAKKMRLPILWERAARSSGPELDFSWADAAMANARAAGIEPIAGLLHHGSGPPHTSLVDPRFPALFADYARRVAERYPQQRLWTPVNEPLTTARFSCLYGLWYPHAADDVSFVRALLNQIQATVLAMRAIRAVNAQAQLVQTDDLGFTRCTPGLAEQAAFDNERRWLGFDLLCGRVDERHPLWKWLRARGAGAQELARLCEQPCPPDIIGINAYVTSERFLDERLELHPPEMHGGNGRQSYVDIETVRVDGRLIDGFAGRLRETHARYGLPIAITEVHLGCTREEQMRWLHQAWREAVQARRDGVDVRAVTPWAAFGTVDWNSLLTREAGNYEPGLWDVRSDPPRLTALGALAASLGRRQAADAKAADAEAADAKAADALAPHPVLEGPGWWQREMRLTVSPHGDVAGLAMRGTPLLIVGCGALAQAFARLAHVRGLPYELLSPQLLDVADHDAVGRALERVRPWAVVDAAADEDVDAAEHDPLHWRHHAEGPAALAVACSRAGIQLLMFSSDLVFPGRDGARYVERDSVGPLNAYGRAKAYAEQRVMRAPDALVIRSAGLFSPWDAGSFVARGIELLREGRAWSAAHDHVLSPTYAPDVVQAALDLLIDGERGLWHLTNGEALSWADFACRAAEHAKLSTRRVRGRPGAELGQVAPRPRCSALRSERGMLLPSLDDALARYLRERDAVGSGPPPLRSAI